jgi:hypothetical protein
MLLLVLLCVRLLISLHHHDPDQQQQLFVLCPLYLLVSIYPGLQESAGNVGRLSLSMEEILIQTKKHSVSVAQRLLFLFGQSLDFR